MHDRHWVGRNRGKNLKYDERIAGGEKYVKSKIVEKGSKQLRKTQTIEIGNVIGNNAPLQPAPLFKMIREHLGDSRIAKQR
jgi:hypothetical protein